MKRRSFILAVALATGVAAMAQAQTPRAIRVGADVDAQSLDPRLMRDTTAYRVANLVFSGLVQLDAQLNATPDLATRWENPDPRTWVFHLRRDARFHDGRPVTAADVVFTYRTLLDPALNARFRSLYTPIQAIEAVDEFTVRMTLSEPYAPMLAYLDMGIVPRHLVEGGANMETNPVGSGPFRFARWQRGARIVLEANETYFGGRPRVSGVEFVIVADNTARAQALEAGDLDIIQSPLSPRDIQRLRANQRFAYSGLAGLAVTYLNFNTRAEPLTDSRVRRALAMMVDQATIVNQIYEGTDRAATSVLMPALAWSYTDQVRQPGFNVAAARSLLEEAGYRRGANGIYAREGRPLRIVLSTHSEDPNRVQAVEFMQNIMRQNGVDVQAAISDWPAFSGNVQRSGHELALLGWIGLVDPDRLLFGQLTSQGSLNWGRFANADLDTALNRGRTALAPADRAGAYRQAAEIVGREMPYYILSYQGFHVFASRDVQGFAADPRGYLRSLAVR